MTKIRLQFETELTEKESAALHRIAQHINKGKEEKKSENKVALGLLKFMLSQLQDHHNCVISVKSIKKG